MIRLYPTSIALSERDVEFHLQEAQIRGHLYAQGYTKEEVQRYYNNQHHSNAHGFDEGHVLTTQNPSAVLARLREDPTQAAKPTILAGGVRTSSWPASVQSESSGENVRSAEKSPSTVSDRETSSPISMPSSPPVMQISFPYRHAAVRQSSLLRIMHTAGSQPSTPSNSSGIHDDLPDYGPTRDEGDLEADDFLPTPATRMRSYRPRSRTYTFIESEADEPLPSNPRSYERDSGPPLLRSRNHADLSEPASAEQAPRQGYHVLNAHSLPSLPHPEISSPLTLPPPLSINRRTSSLQFSLPERTRPSTPWIANQLDSRHQPSEPLEPNLPMNSNGLDTSTIDLNTSTIGHPPTTPSPPPTSPGRPSLASPRETSSAMTQVPGHVPSTPTRTADSSRTQGPAFFDSPESSFPEPPQTEPTQSSRRGNGTFGVYNDGLPADAQPQTPADLQSPRRRALPERNVAYTAPPGQIRTMGRLIAQDYYPEMVGARSPTLRAARMRERRAREFGRWRTARMESLRGSTGRGISEEEGGAGVEAEVDVGLGTDGTITPQLAGRRFDGQDEVAERAERAERRLVQEWALFATSRRPMEVGWRHEFDEDRVGEENFEAMPASEGRGRRRTATDEGEEDDARHVGFTVMATTPEP